VLPSRNPPYAPSNKPLCRVRVPGDSGYDYGNRLYVVDDSATPVWRAGRYHPERGELDCIGLVVLAFTPTTVRFRLGWAYAHRDYTPLTTGSHVRLVVNGASIRTRVKFSGLDHLAKLLAILDRVFTLILRVLPGAK
jgi:hypothetical protein